jgi:hypothetical protein
MNGTARGIGQFNKYHSAQYETIGKLRYYMSSLTSQHSQHPWEPDLMLRYTSNRNGGCTFGNGASIGKPMVNDHRTHITLLLGSDSQ